MTFKCGKLVFLVVLVPCICESTAIRESSWKRKFNWTTLQNRPNILICIVECMRNPNVDSLHVTNQINSNSCTCLELNGKTDKVKKQGCLYVWDKPQKTMADAIRDEIGRSNHLLFLFYSSKSGSRIVVHKTSGEENLFIELYNVQYEIYGISIDIPTNQVFHGGETIKCGSLTFSDFEDIFTNQLGQNTVVLAADIAKNILYLVQKEYAGYSSKDYSFDILDIGTGKKKTHAHVQMRTFGDAVIDVKNAMVFYIAKGYKLKSFDYGTKTTKRVGTRIVGASQRLLVFDNQLMHCEAYESKFTIYNLKTRRENTFQSSATSCGAMARTEGGQLVFVFKNCVTITNMKGELVRKLNFRNQPHMLKGSHFYEPYVVACN